MRQTNREMAAFLSFCARPFFPSSHNHILKQGLSELRQCRLSTANARPFMATTPSGASGNTSRVNPNSTNRSSSQNPSDFVASWQQELRLLLDPKMPPGAKQVLLQDLAKRAPEILNDSCFESACKDAGLGGVADVVRQFQNDFLPDLLSNGSRYVAKVAEGLPQTLSKMAADSDSVGSGMPTSFTREDAQREFRNIFNKTPEGLYTPSYKVIASLDGYEIRKYPSLIVAETRMMAGSSVSPATEVETASAMGQSFNNLAGYLFGKNEGKSAMKMTTPVILDKGVPEETMSFIIGEYDSVDAVPKALDQNVTLREQPGQTLAVIEFTGFVTQGEAKRQREMLLSKLARDGVKLAEGAQDAYKCMIYNGPTTLPNLRRNELMLEVVYPTAE